MSFFIASCVDYFTIPEDINPNSSNIFGAGDTTFLLLSPNWDESYGLESPTEISTSPDGRIFVADKNINSIHVLNQDGSVPEGFSGLKSLKNEEGNPLYPIDLDIDNKMNVYFIDGSQMVYVWNQHWNEVGINKAALSAIYRNKETQFDTILDINSDLWSAIINDEATDFLNDWELVENVFSKDDEIINGLLNPHAFYDGREDINIFNDSYYQSDSSRFQGLTSNRDENNIFVVDDFGGGNNQHRIVQINLKRKLLIELGTGDIVWVFKGEFGSTIKGYGTGAGTVHYPLSLDIDYQGNLYYTQAGDFFPVHMVVPNYSGDFATFTSGFQPGVNDIMNSGQYMRLADVTVDNDKTIYVVDQMQAEIKVFNSQGDFFKNIKYYSEQDSINIMNKPVAVTVDNRGVVYVCDEEDKTIYRFKLSNNLNEDIVIEN
jgi:hypothetical protein